MRRIATTRQPVDVALDGPFDQASSGFVGTSSDGLAQLDAGHALTPTFTDANGGNVAQTARLKVADGKPFTVLALGFGPTQAEAVATAEGSLAADFDKGSKGLPEGLGEL